MKNIENLFVYGTLQKGKQHENFLKNLNGTWKKGYVFGNLINIGFGENYGYPGLKLNKNGPKIYGMIFQSKNLQDKINEIDYFEGDNYKRKISQVYFKNGTKIQAYLYELKKNNEKT